MKYKICILMCSVISCSVMADTLQQGYAGDYYADWANESMNATASGYNDGSVMNEGRHWSAADDFMLSSTGQQWRINSLSFACGGDIGAIPTDIRVSVFEDNLGMPANYDNELFRYEEALTSLNKFSITSTSVGGTKDRYVYDMTLDMSSFDLLLNGDTQYYLSIEGDVSNSQDVYNGFDTYYQRFYALRSDTGDSFYTSQINSQWEIWQQLEGDLIWSIDVTEIPEPCSLVLIGFGGLVLRRKQ